MKVLVVGNGAREHALVWKIRQSPLMDQIFCAPGNAGIEQIAKCVAISADDVEALAEFALALKIDLTVIGPEAPLVKGIADEFQKRGLKVVGPTKAAAQIEGSKVWMKGFLERWNIPTADSMIFKEEDVDKATTYAMNNAPCVVKADGLAGGKGVFVCQTADETSEAIGKLMVWKELGDAGRNIVVEELLKGQELSYTVLTDGKAFLPLLTAQDHKPVFDNDQGPNTGGMGAYAPVPWVTKKLDCQIQSTIIEPALRGLREEGRLYKGFLYAGLMITQDGPKVLEFNCRLGDPETQPILMQMEDDIVPMLMAVANGLLLHREIKWKPGAAICVTMASQGYPGKAETNREITGWQLLGGLTDVALFHGATRQKEGALLTSGGRVLSPTLRSDEGLPEAVRRIYEFVLPRISFEGEHHRNDIGQKALKFGLQTSMKL